MLRRFRPSEAPNQYSFKDPDTGRDYSAPSMAAIVKEITNYRKQNKLSELAELPMVVESYMCNLPENLHRSQVFQLPKRTFMEYVKGGIYLVKNLMHPTFATQEEADRRANQCVKCPLNTVPENDRKFQTWTDAVAIREVGQRRTLNHDKLGTCAGCGCPLKSKVFVDGPLSPFEPDKLARLKSVKCWQLKLSNQE